MELTVEYEKDLFIGSYPAVLVHPDETLSYVYQDSGAYYGRTVTVDVANNNNSTIGTASVITTDASPTLISSLHIGQQNWLVWKSADRQRVAMVPESPRIMNEAFYRGFITGNTLRHTGTHDPYILSEYANDIPDEDRISYNNGLLLGQVCTL